MTYFKFIHTVPQMFLADTDGHFDIVLTLESHFGQFLLLYKSCSDV